MEIECCGIRQKAVRYIGKQNQYKHKIELYHLAKCENCLTAKTIITVVEGDSILNLESYKGGMARKKFDELKNKLNRAEINPKKLEMSFQIIASDYSKRISKGIQQKKRA